MNTQNMNEKLIAMLKVMPYIQQPLSYSLIWRLSKRFYLTPSVLSSLISVVIENKKL